MSRSRSDATYAFGPGHWTPAVRAIIITNVVVFFATLVAPGLVPLLGLSPDAVLRHGWLWQPVTYLFVHGSPGHILFNMLAVWMFGVDLENRWGPRAFTWFYFVTGIGAGLCTILVSLLPFDVTRAVFDSTTIGASGAVYGLLMAWAIVYPRREVLLFLLFPVQARFMALIFGAITLYMALGSGGGPVAHFAHLGGLLVAWLYLKGPRGLQETVRYRLMKWRMDRMRRRFDVHQGGRDGDWRNRIH